MHTLAAAPTKPRLAVSVTEASSNFFVLWVADPSEMLDNDINQPGEIHLIAVHRVPCFLEAYRIRVHDKCCRRWCSDMALYLSWEQNNNFKLWDFLSLLLTPGSEDRHRGMTATMFAGYHTVHIHCHLCWSLVMQLQLKKPLSLGKIAITLPLSSKHNLKATFPPTAPLPSVLPKPQMISMFLKDPRSWHFKLIALLSLFAPLCLHLSIMAQRTYHAYACQGLALT